MRLSTFWQFTFIFRALDAASVGLANVACSNTATTCWPGGAPVQDLVAEAAAGAAAKANGGRMFKLEDIAVGSWVAYIARERGWRVRYVCLEVGGPEAGCPVRMLRVHAHVPLAPAPEARRPLQRRLCAASAVPGTGVPVIGLHHPTQRALDLGRVSSRA